MVYRMYALYNAATELYEGIMLYRSDVVAQRGFEATLESAKGKLDASDFTMYCLGTFDNESCSLVPFPSPQKVEFVSKFIPEEESMSSERDQNSVL